MVELSIVMACLDEEATIGICVDKAKKVLKDNNIDGEIIVSDNGSSDNSAKIAKAKGATVVKEAKKGYGNAYLRGFEKAQGKYLMMIDSDNTLDILEIPKFLNLMRVGGVDLLIGSRLKGKIMPGAMPWLHRRIGVPVLTWFTNRFFHTKLSDAQCGMRMLTKETYNDLNLKTSGMEFASEMLIKAAKEGKKIKEVPVSYYPRKEGTAPKLHSLRDGWRNFRFMLLFAPEWLFMVPGTIFFVLGIIFLLGVLNTPLDITTNLDIYLMVSGAFSIILGLHIIIFGFKSKIYAHSVGFERDGQLTNFVKRNLALDKGTLIGIAIFLVGLLSLTYTFNTLFAMPVVAGLRFFILSLTLIVVGLEVIFSSWFLSMVGIERE